MNQKFKRLKILDYCLLSIYDFLLIALALSLFLIQIYNIIGIIGPLVIAILLIITSFFRAKLSRDFKKNILTSLLSDQFLNTTYSPTVENDKETIDLSHIFNNDKLNIKSEDLITGSYHNIKFESFDSIINKTIGSGFDKELITVFEGRVIFIDYPNDFFSIVREKDEEDLFGHLEYPLIKTNNQEFDDKFSLYGDLLDDDLLSTIHTLEESFQGEFCIAFNELGIFIFKSDFFNGFEIDDTTSIDLIRKEFEDEMAFIVKAIRLLCLK